MHRGTGPLVLIAALLASACQIGPAPSPIKLRFERAADDDLTMRFGEALLQATDRNHRFSFDAKAPDMVIKITSRVEKLPPSSFRYSTAMFRPDGVLLQAFNGECAEGAMAACADRIIQDAQTFIDSRKTP